MSKMTAELLAYNPAFDDDFEGQAIDQASLAEPETVTVDSVIALTSRLAQLLAEEADLLAQMKVSSLENLQDEKRRLTDALDLQRRELVKNPSVIADMDPVDRMRLEQIASIFENVSRENYRRLLVAREVNKKVVEAISAAAQEAASNGLYTKKAKAAAPYASISLSLNECI